MRVLAAALVLAACQAVEPEVPEPFGITMVEETTCIGAGGAIVVGLAGPTCAMPTADAGQACRADSDCDGFCLAPEGAGDVGQCTPSSPYFGCFEVLLGGGQRATLCVD